MFHYNTLLTGMAQRGSEREFVSDPDTMHLSVDCSLSERDGKGDGKGTADAGSDMN